jgi:DNA-binding NarL/FixJ family response regulator
VDAAHQVFPRGEVVVQRGFGDPQLVRDVLQAGALHALLKKQVASDLLDSLPGV